MDHTVASHRSIFLHPYNSSILLSQGINVLRGSIEYISFITFLVKILHSWLSSKLALFCVNIVVCKDCKTFLQFIVFP